MIQLCERSELHLHLERKFVKNLTKIEKYDNLKKKLPLSIFWPIFLFSRSLRITASSSGDPPPMQLQEIAMMDDGLSQNFS